MLKTQCLGAVIGAFVGDALGVPYEYKTRRELMLAPCTDMIGYGKHYQPPGHWSDDAATLWAQMAALMTDQGFNPITLMENLQRWLDEGDFCAGEMPFEYGFGLFFLLARYRHLKASHGVEFAILNSNYNDPGSNLNEVLARMVPVALYALHLPADEAVDLAMRASAVTFANQVSTHCSAFFTLFVRQLCTPGQDVMEALIQTRASYLALTTEMEWRVPTEVQQGLLDQDLYALVPGTLNNCGMVQDTLQLAIWALLNFDSYPEAVLAVISQGGLTTTHSCVTGALAGLYYGFNAIPENWRKALPKRVMLEAAATDFYDFISELDPVDRESRALVASA